MEYDGHWKMLFNKITLGYQITVHFQIKMSHSIDLSRIQIDAKTYRSSVEFSYQDFLPVQSYFCLWSTIIYFLSLVNIFRHIFSRIDVIIKLNKIQFENAMAYWQKNLSCGQSVDACFLMKNQACGNCLCRHSPRRFLGQNFSDF